jgi:hypothetical protein
VHQVFAAVIIHQSQGTQSSKSHTSLCQSPSERYEKQQQYLAQIELTVNNISTYASNRLSNTELAIHNCIYNFTLIFFFSAKFRKMDIMRMSRKKINLRKGG